MEHIPPTIKQKLRIYKRAKRHVRENGQYRCICVALRQAQRELNFVNADGIIWQMDGNIVQFAGSHIIFTRTDNDMVHNFPELLRHKPEGVRRDMRWWDLYDNKPHPIRLEVIDSIIAELKAELISTKANEKS